MTGAKPISTPAISGSKLSAHEGTPLKDPSSYRSVVGALQYLTMTRPDIAYAVNQVCQFMSKPTDTYFNAVKRILRYIKGTLGHGLQFQASSDLSIRTYSDADWAGCPDDRRSTTGGCTFFGPNLVSWCSRKEYDSVLTGGPWLIADHYLTIRRWTPYFRSDEASIDRVEAWIRLPLLPM